jgi:nucleotide sugar dehydrogenase
MNIGIVGQGFVGTAVNEGFKPKFNVETYDIAKDSTCKSIDELAIKSDVIFVCLPTPMKENGECYLGILEEVISDLDSANRCKTIVVKSTIPPGTTEKFNEIYENIDIVFNPEFLTEANSIEDFKNQNRIIIGGPRPATTKVRRIFRKVFPKVPIIKTGSTHAEMVKYITNCFLATKVSFANEIFKLCKQLDLDYDKVIEYAKFDDRLGYSHWDVPGPDGDFGFGGHCFPKDMNALIYLGDQLGIDLKILKSALETNNKVRSNRDWEQQKGRAII